MSSTWDALADLPLTVERAELEGRSVRVRPEFTRHTTLVHFVGPAGPAGDAGIGEDVTYGAEEQLRLQADGPPGPLAGSWTLASFSEHLDSLALFPAPPSQAAYRDYRRWALESAALDLALRQAGASLGAVLGRDARPVHFAVSLGLGQPPTAEPVRKRLAAGPATRLKLDASSAWTEDLAAELAATGRVDTVDLKGAYRGTIVDQPPDRALYELVVRCFPRAWIEDPGRSPETDAVLADHWDRVTWDAPIHSVADVTALEHRPRTLNVKPSRFGTLERLCDFYDFCAREGIALYGGGQFELGAGREQIQLLAALFHPDAPNDVAPAVYHTAAPGDDLPRSPLVRRERASGFGWARPE